LAVAGPDVFELFEVLEPFERAERVGLEIEDFEFGILRQRREGFDFVVGEVELGELREGFDSV
jgi:hypothetical protein